jgi:hypothetical protein
LLLTNFLFLLFSKLGDLLEWIDGILAVKKSNGENKEGEEVEKEAEKEESSNQSSSHTVAATEGRDNIPGDLYGNTVKGIKDTGESNGHPYVPYTLSSSYVTDITGQPGQNAVTVITYEIPSKM